MVINNAVNASQAGVQCQTSAGVWNGRTITAGSGISVTNGDGVSGNPTISATGSSGGLGTVLVYDDFLGWNAVGSAVGNANLTTSVLNGNAGGQNTTGANPGVFAITTGTSTTGSAAIFGSVSGASSGDFTLGSGTVTIQWVAAIPTLSIAAQRFTVRIGLFNNMGLATNTPNDGCWFEYIDNVNSGAWTINCKGNSGTTTQNTASTADTSYHNYKIIVNAAATSVAFYIDGVEVTNSPLTTNIPTDGITFCAQISKSVGNTERQVNIDLVLFQYDLTTPRPG